MRRIILIGSGLGSCVFALLFCMTFLSLDLIDKSARAFVVSRIEKEVSEHAVIGMKLKGVGEKLSWLKDKYGSEIEAAKDQLKSGLRLKIEEILNLICNVECLKKKGITITDTTDDYLRDRIAQLTDTSQKLSELVKGKYYRIIYELLHDLRIFSGVNFMLFLSIVAVLLLKSAAAKPLLLPAGLLFVSTIASIGIYLLGQNWFYTLLFSNYMGWGYLAYVAVIFAFLMDIVFNGAQITAAVVDGIASFFKEISQCFPGA